MIHKMYCIFAKESLVKMNGIRGKMAAQAGHAYLHAFWDATKFTNPWVGLFSESGIQEHNIQMNKCEQAQAYQAFERAYKITLVVDTVEDLRALHDKYKDVCGVSLVTDAGFTVFNEPTTTCLGIGPIREDKIGEDLKSLKTLT